MKKVTLLLLICLFSLALGKTLHTVKDGFSFRRIHSLKIWASEDFNEETRNALSQTFHYLGRGRQCFAFESADHQYVLKFPRTDIYTTPIWMQVLPLKRYQTKTEFTRSKRKRFVLNSFEIAHQDLKDDTAMIALHLGQSSSRKKITLIDKCGCKHQLPIGKLTFALQYKKPLLIDQFKAAHQRGDKNEVRKILDALVLVIRTRAEKGILNKDRSFLKNFAFDGEKAYQIDVGSFYYNPNLSKNDATFKSMMDSIDPIQEWLKSFDPEILEYLNAKLNDT